MRDYNEVPMKDRQGSITSRFQRRARTDNSCRIGRFPPERQNKPATSPPIERRAIAIAALAGSCGDNRSEKTTANLRENIDGFVRPL
jgi:hypothetical protein